MGRVDWVWATPPGDALHFSARIGPLLLKWERHSEFSSYTFAVDGPFAQPFKEPPADHLPADWLKGIPGETIAALHIAIEADSAPDRTVEETATLFDNNTIIGSVVLGGQARAWTDARIHADGFGRYLLKNMNLNQRQLGRLVQRLVEIETYRIMAMLAFPLARAARPRVAALEQDLTAAVRRLPEITIAWCISIRRTSSAVRSARATGCTDSLTPWETKAKRLR